MPPLKRWAENLKTMSKHIFLALSMILLHSCDRQEKEVTGSRIQPASNDRQWKPGDRDDEGSLVVFVPRTGAPCYEILKTDHALVFLNVGRPEAPKVQFDLASREAGLESFSSVDTLMERIQRVSEPRTIDFWTTCAGPPWLGAPQELVDEFFAKMNAAKVTLRYAHSCTCQ